jgi:hypothetical protein
MSAFDWNEFLRLAIKLSNDADEASQRTAISRAYYFAFNMAMRRAVANGYRFAEGVGSTHDQLWALYDRNTDAASRCKQIAFLGGRIKRKRVIADYRPVFSNPSQELLGVIEDAKKCAEILSVLDVKYPEPVERMHSF